MHGDPIQGVDPTGLASLNGTIAAIGIAINSIAMSATSSAYALTSVYGAAGFVMLHDELIALFSAGRSIVTGRDESGDQLTLAGYMFAFGLLAVSFVPGDFADDALRHIAAYRASKNLRTVYQSTRDPKADRKANGVVAVLRIDGDDYVAHNKWVSDAGLNAATVKQELTDLGVTYNAITPFHAEGGVLYQALKDGKKAKSAELFVDATFCSPCGEGRGLRGFAEALGLDELTINIRLTNGHIIQGLYDLSPVGK